MFRFKELVDGIGKYRGMKRLLVAWVFCKFLWNDNEEYSISGVKQVDGDNETRKRPSDKIISEHKIFFSHAVGKYGHGPRIIRNHYGTGILWASAYNGSNRQSMYEFLQEHAATYPEWEPAVIQPMNRYDI